MAVRNRKQAEDDARDRALPNTQGARYKFMTSILTPGLMRGMYLKPLEKVTSDPKVPFHRIVIAMGACGFALVMGLKQLMDDTTRAQYITLPMILLVASMLVMGVIFMLSSREKSMLLSVADLNLFKIGERIRDRKNLHLTGIGISEITKSGKLLMESGRVGYVYKVRGELSPSTMPGTAEAIATARYQYLVSRTKDSQEMRITAIAPNDFSDQLRSLNNISRKWESRNDGLSEWRQGIAEQQYVYMDDLAHQSHQLTLEQYVILTDADDASLRRSSAGFERQLRGRVYDARMQRLTGRADIEKALGPLALMSGEHID